MLAWSTLLPAILTEPGVRAPPTGAPCTPWKFDTGCAPDANAWRFHLERAGLDPTNTSKLDPEKAKTRFANDAVEELPIRAASLWLVSNIPALRQSPFPLFLFPGVPFYDRSPRRTTNLFPLLGMTAFRRAGLTVKINFKAATLSVWTPGPWYRGWPVFARRLLDGFARTPFDQLCGGP